MTDAPKKRGRPIDEHLTPLILEIVRQMTIEKGVSQVTTAMIAKAAGVSKQSLYRRWPGKVDMVFEAIKERGASFGEVLDGPPEVMLDDFLNRLFTGLQVDGKIICGFVAEAQNDHVFREKLAREFTSVRDAQIASMLQRCIAHGDLPKDANLALAAEMVHGAFWYRLLLGVPLDAKFAHDLSRQIIASLRG